MHYCKYNTNYILLACLLVFSFLNSPTFGSKYPIQNFTSDQYKAGIQNIDFAQNRDMTLFIANNLAVLSYNGIEWERHAYRTGKKQRSLAFDEDNNRLFVGSQGEFGYFEADWSYVSLVDIIPEEARNFDEVWDVYLFESMVYFCTFQGIYVFDGKKISVLRNEEGFYHTFSVSGKLITQSQDGTLFEIRGTLLYPYLSRKLSAEVLTGIIERNDGYILFYNSGKIEFTSPFEDRNKYDALIDDLQGTYVNHVLPLSDGRLAISTQTAGLFLYDFIQNQVEKISTRDGLQSNACLLSFQDYSGNLWVGMQNGIALIHSLSSIRLTNSEIDLQGSGYDAYETEEGIYFTTSNGIYFLDDEAEECLFLEGTEGPAYGLQMIAGKLYAGHHSGLFLLQKNKAIPLAKTDGLWHVKQLSAKPQWVIGGTYSGLYLFKIGVNRMLEPVRKIEGFDESSRFFEEDQEGNIWVGQYYKGLYLLRLDDQLQSASVEKISDNSGLPLKDQIILEKIDNDLYLATKEGIYIIDQNTDQIKKARLFEESMGDQAVYLLKQDKQKNIHVVSENMVGYYKRISANNFVFTPSSLSQLRFNFNNDLLNVSINVRDWILFSANEGFIQFNPDLEELSSAENVMIVSEVFSVTDDQSLYARQPFEDKREQAIQLVITPKQKVLQFKVESFQFSEVKYKQFRYYLKGFDKGFGDWTNRSVKEYTNLKEGSYEFLAQTKDHFGKISSALPLVLRVKPPFYKSTLAGFVYIALFLLLFVLLYVFQKKRYKKSALELENMRKNEVAEEQRRMIEIEHQKEQELLKLKDEQTKSELRHLNKQLADTTMNLVVKNEFIENIKSKLKELRKRMEKAETQQFLEQLEKEINFTLRLQEDWESFEHHFDQLHGDFLSRLRNEYDDISPNEQKLCAFLRLNLSTKEIANLMNVSVRGIEIARYRLRKKLKLEKGQNLTKFILEY
jgi:DNA-binding CsgD family transcriptional regulator